MAVLIALVRRHRRAVGAAARRAVGDEVPGTIEEEAGPAAVRRVPPGLLDVRCLYMPLVRLASPLWYETWVRARSLAMKSQMRPTSPGI